MAVSIKAEEFSALVVASAWTAHSLKPVFNALLETSPRWGGGLGVSGVPRSGTGEESTWLGRTFTTWPRRTLYSRPS